MNDPVWSHRAVGTGACRPALVLTALICLVLAGCATPSSGTGGTMGDPPAEALLTEGAATLQRSADSMRRAGRFEEAARLYREAWQRAPEDATLALAHAEMLRRTGSTRQAVLFLKGEAPSFRENAALAHELARAALQGGYLEDAELAVRAAETLAPDAWETALLAGVLAARRAEFETAMAALRRAERLAPSEVEDPSVLSIANNMALVEAQSGEIVRAITRLERLVERPEAPETAFRNLALLYALAGDAANFERMAGRRLDAEAMLEARAWLAAMTGALPPAGGLVTE